MTDQILLSEVTTRISIHCQDVHINFEATDNAIMCPVVLLLDVCKWNMEPIISSNNSIKTDYHKFMIKGKIVKHIFLMKWNEFRCLPLSINIRYFIWLKICCSMGEKNSIGDRNIDWCWSSLNRHISMGFLTTNSKCDCYGSTESPKVAHTFQTEFFDSFLESLTKTKTFGKQMRTAFPTFN